MKRVTLTIFSILCLIFAAQADDLNKLKAAIVKQLLSNTQTDAIVGDLARNYFPDGTNYDLCIKELIAHALPLDSEVEELLSTMKEDGSWGFIDYNSRSRSAWSAQIHVDNLMKLARAYRSSDSKYYYNHELIQKALKGINYWCDGKFVCTNWWYNEIGVPKVMAPLLLLLENEISDELMAKGIVVLDAADEREATGQNKVWLSGVTFIKGILLNDDAIMKRTSRDICEELRVTTEEGIQPDFSFHQHGAMLQFGNYGLAFASSISYWMRIFDGTAYDFAPEQKIIMRNYMTKGLAMTTWRGAMDVSSCVRQLIVNGQEGKAGSLFTSNLNMIEMDSEVKDLYEGYIKRNYLTPEINDLQGNFVYPISKYTVHRAANFMFTIKMFSKRIIGGEVTNDENLKGYHLSDGATMIYTNGKEYSNIFPIWDGKYMPGTTSEVNKNPLRILKNGTEYLNGSDFVGGVSSGMNGVTAIEFDRNGVKANKSWFFLDSVVICLGNNITAESGDPLVTTLNQCFYQDATYYQKKGKITELEIEKKGSSTKVYSDNIGYESLDGSSINFTVKEQEGDWHDVALFYESEVEVGDVFTAQIAHKAGKTGSYAYAVKPAIDKNLFFSDKSSNDFIITQNDTSASIVESEKGETTMIVFWKSGSVESKLYGKVESSAPSMVIIENIDGKINCKTYDPLGGSVVVSVNK